jgi:cobalt-zinc-cadmium efflux system protein
MFNHKISPLNACRSARVRAKSVMPIIMMVSRNGKNGDKTVFHGLRRLILSMPPGGLPVCAPQGAIPGDPSPGASLWKRLSAALGFQLKSATGSAEAGKQRETSRRMNEYTHHYTEYSRAFLVGVLLNVAFVILEAAYGFLAGSLALVADAGHNLGDVVGLLLAWGGTYLARRRRTPRRTYGWRRSTIYAALLNAVFIFLVVGGIALEAVQRLGDPPPTAAATVIVVAGVGVGVNVITALMFASGRHGDLNIRGAFLHMAADAAVSLGVVAAGLAILLTGWLWLDPAASLAISVVILIGTWGLLRDSVNLAMDAVPSDIEPGNVRAYLEGLDGVVEVHDLHIWAMSTTEIALTAHLVQDGSVDPQPLLTEAGEQLHERFGIGHSTLQWERSSAGGSEGTCRVPCDDECRMGGQK